MQKKVVMFLSLLLNIQNIIGQEPIPISSEKPKVTAHQLYIMVKELIYAHTILPFWIDFKKARSAQVFCDFCGRSVNSFITYGDLIVRGQGQKILILKRLWYKYDIYQIEQFLYKVHNELQIPCISCLAFHGWHCNYNSSNTDYPNTHES